MPWYINEIEERRGQSIGKMDKIFFEKKVLFCLIGGGMFEFIGSVMVLLSFQKALEVGMNQGISNSMITVSGVIIVVMSYILYRERISISQAVGILMILLAIVLISLSKNDQPPTPAGLSLAEIFASNSTTTEPAPAPASEPTPAPAPAPAPSSEPAPAP